MVVHHRSRFQLFLRIALAVVFSLTAVMGASCAKKKIQPVYTGPASDDEAARLAREQELERQRKLREEELAGQHGRLDKDNLTGKDAQNPDIVAFVSNSIYFEFDSAYLSPEAQETLREKAAFLQKHPNASAVIQGHTDERGTGEYNLALGDRRAEAAKNFLLELGIDTVRISTVSFGEERPEDPGHQEQAWSKNRRAEFVLER